MPLSGLLAGSWPWLAAIRLPLEALPPRACPCSAPCAQQRHCHSRSEPMYIGPVSPSLRPPVPCWAPLAVNRSGGPGDSADEAGGAW